MHVILQDLAPGTRARGGERVGRVDEDRLDRRRIVIAVVALHRVNDLALLAVLLEHLTSELEVRSFHLAIDRLADIVQETAALRDRVVHAELHRHQRGELRDLERMHEHVLPVGRAVTKPAEELEDLGVDVGDAERERRGLPFLEQLLIELLTHLLDELLDAGGVDAAVLHEAFERDTRDLAADRIEAGEDDRLRRVVDDQVDAGRQLERADVASLAADDAALHVLAREVDHADRVLGHVVRRHALDRHAEDLARALVAELVRLGLDPLDDVGGVDLGLVLDPADQLALRLVRRETGDLFEAMPLRFDERVQLVLA